MGELDELAKDLDVDVDLGELENVTGVIDKALEKEERHEEHKHEKKHEHKKTKSEHKKKSEHKHEHKKKEKKEKKEEHHRHEHERKYDLGERHIGTAKLPHDMKITVGGVPCHLRIYKRIPHSKDTYSANVKAGSEMRHRRKKKD